ncbi:hypothetical protein C4J98_0386 [Pseudomonas orientalis]|nr:hypothetical protein C4J98_0386 [Pseudomonas orientalis]
MEKLGIIRGEGGLANRSRGLVDLRASSRHRYLNNFGATPHLWRGSLLS